MFSSSTKSSASLPATLAIDASTAYSSNAASAAEPSVASCGVADLAEDALGRHLHVLKNERRGRRTMEAHLVFFFAALHAEPPLDEERRELIAVHLGEDDEEIGEAAVGDPHLLAVEDEGAVGLA